MLYSAATKAKPKATYENILFEYATARATEQNDPGLQTGLGEPKCMYLDTVMLEPETDICQSTSTTPSSPDHGADRRTTARRLRPSR